MWKQFSSGETKIDDLIEQLEKIEGAMPGAVSRNPRAGIRKSIDFLKKHPGKFVSQLVTELEATPKPTTRAKRPAAPLRTNIVNQAVDDLQYALRKGVSTFDTVMGNLQRDKQVRLKELKAIVAEFTGDKSAVKSKSDGFARIRKTFDYKWKLAERV